MEYEAPYVREFAARTRKNLEFVKTQQQLGEDVYEVTQLVTSLLGLLILPQKRFLNVIPKTPLAEHELSGWPAIQITKGQSECRTLSERINSLR